MEIDTTIDTLPVLNNVEQLPLAEPASPQWDGYEPEIAAALRWFHPMTGVIELRPENEAGKRESGFYTDFNLLVKDAADHYGRAVQFTLNEIATIPEGANKHQIGRAEKGRCTSSNIVTRVSNIVFDCDPVRPKGWPANDAEHAASLLIARKIESFLNDSGFPQGALFDSGNGTYYALATDLSPSQNAMVKALVEFISDKFSTPEVTVDKSVYRLAQLIRLAGTWNRKKEATSERPHRVAKIISIPEKREFVTPKMITDLLPLKAVEETPINLTAPGEPVDETQFDIVIQRHIRCLRSKKIDFTVEDVNINSEACKLLRLHKCPFKSKDQSDGRSWVRFSRRGISAGCFHGNCAGKNLEDFYKSIGWDKWLAQHDLKDVVDKEGIKEEYNNPHRLAESFKKKTSIGTDRIHNFQGEKFYRWQDGIHRPYSEKALTPYITASVKDDFDTHASGLAKKGGSGVTAAVKRSTTNDVLNALKSIVVIPSDLKAPCWLSSGNGDANDYIPFKNGLLHVPSYLAGSPDCFIPPTPAFFNTHALGFNYNPEAPVPTRWIQFINELWSDTKCHDLLHEWGGYCMTRDTSLQKFMTFLGVPRAGKGTLIQVLKEVVGHNVGAVSHRQILGKNGYEQLAGKQLAIFPDAKGVPKNILAEYCGVLCAITGEDEVTIDAKYEKLTREQLKLKIIVQLNEIMAIPDAANALKARQLFLLFTRTFADDPNLDPHLKEKLIAEIEGIANLFLLGLKRLHDNGRIFTEPESSKTLAAEVQREATPCRAFLDDLCVVEPGQAVASIEMNTAYLQWCKQREIEPTKTLRADIRSACKKIDYVQSADGLQSSKTFTVAPRIYFTGDLGRRPYYYTGVRMKSNDELDAELGLTIETVAEKKANHQAHLAEHTHEKPEWMRQVIALEKKTNDFRAAMKAYVTETKATYKTLASELKEQFKIEREAHYHEDYEVFMDLRSQLFKLYVTGMENFDMPSHTGMKVDDDKPYDFFAYVRSLGFWDDLKTDAGTVE